MRKQLTLSRHVVLIVALMAVVFAVTACGGDGRYAGESRTEAKVIGDRYIVRHFAQAALWSYSGMHKAHVLGREAWMLIYARGPLRVVCVYVWWAFYHDDDYAIGRKCS